MRSRGRRYRRRTNKGVLLLLLLLSAVFLVSCVAGANPLWVRGVLGVDIANYNTESIDRTLPTDGAVAETLCDMVEILTANSAYLKTFRTPSQAVNLYRDAILNDLLRDNYLLYTGNRYTLSVASAVYAGNISTAIPAADFERAAYRYFGATGVRHKDGELFVFLRDARAYTAPVQAWESGVEIAVETLEQTANTYRMRFRLSDDASTSQVYTATFAKHTDGTLYFYSLEQ